MLETIVKPVKKVEPEFVFTAGEDGYTRGINICDETGHRVCHMSQSIGHCCAASMIGALSSYGFWNKPSNVNRFIAEMRRHWIEQENFRSKEGQGLSVFNISGFYVLLSVETAGHDKALRGHKDIVKVHSFKNKRGGPAMGEFGHEISLYFMEFKA